MAELDKMKVLGRLNAVLVDVHAAFEQRPGPDHSARLEQLDSALANARASVEALFDEDERERDLHQRLAGDEGLGSRHGHQLNWATAEGDRVAWDARKEAYVAGGKVVDL